MPSPLDLAAFLRGPFGFLRADEDDLLRLGKETRSSLPHPQRIFLEAESATPVRGFPVLQSTASRALREALEAYVQTEEDLELGLLQGQPPDRRTVDAAWEYYRRLLGRATENVVSSSYGRGYGSVFWLFHSIAVARQFKEVPKHIRRRRLDLGKLKGDEIKYRIFHRYLDRTLQLTYEIVARVAGETQEEESDLFPVVLERMRDNVLILTEDHVSPNLAELSSYFQGYLHVDHREFRGRLEALREWYTVRSTRYPGQNQALRHFLGEDRDPLTRFSRPGFLSFLSETPGYDEDRYLPKEWVSLWESLLLKLKEFELLATMRRLVVPIATDDSGKMSCSASSIGWTRSGPGEVALSETTRPMDFMAPWVVEPQVKRYGLIYDITDFSNEIATLRRSGHDRQDDAFRSIFALQRRINKIATRRRLRLEKYLGDGAFYSGRAPDFLLAAAVHLQRSYRRAIAEGFPFDHGLRIALNYGTYRLLPIEAAAAGSDHRYEFFGHGIIELTRLVTGKSDREIEDMKTLLVSRGYPPRDVERFFAPISRRHVYLADKREESRDFFAYISPSGVLVNEGIVATEALIVEIDRFFEAPLYRVQDGDRAYIALEVVDEPDEPLLVAVRRLGIAGFKGIGDVAVYEVVDGGGWSGMLQAISERSLLIALGHLFAESSTTPTVRTDGGMP
jgi:hypothetical protein